MTDIKETKLPEQEQEERVKGRVLVQTTISGQVIRPNQVISLPVSIAENYEKAGEIDLNEDAVAYALTKNPNVVELD